LLPSAGQFGVQQPAIDMTAPIGHGHLPLQPSSWPAPLPSVGQVGVQMHVPWMQWPLAPQFLPPQSQVSTQVPLLQTLPAKHCTPSHRFFTHVPPLQICPLGHWTFAHGFAAAQVSAHARPVPQFALQALSAMHLPVPRSQVWPEGQVTPAHGWRKQPVTHRPSTHVWLAEQVTPAHGSVVGTQVAWQVLPPPQPITFAPLQGSAWQLPPRQT